MRTPLRLALAFVLTAVAAPSRADERPAMSTQESSFELFGTSVCFAETGARCDLQLPANLLSRVPVASDTATPRAWRFLGLTFCSELQPTGPACDVVYVPPESTAVAWRDIRMGVAP
jgi:hypothetical protein